MSLSANSKKLLRALQKGTVVNAGGVLMDAEHKGLRMTFTELYYAVQELKKAGHSIERIDAGGRPEWMLMEATAC